MTWAVTLTGVLITFGASAYALAALFARPRHLAPGDATVLARPVSILKPLFGADGRLEENLASLCVQDHPEFEILCGVRDPGDAAVAVVERVRSRFPAVALRLVIDPRIHGTNLKVSNLINLEGLARHDWIVIADSDVAVAPDYLKRVTAPLADAQVGIVTCLYRGRPMGGFWTRLGMLFIDAWFVPSARLASALGSEAFGFGATIALRRAVLHDIGGLDAVRNRLADDFWLGELTRERGLRTVLSDVSVTTDVVETRLAAVWAREVRWLRTIRSLNGLGFAFLFITFTLPMLALGVALAPSAPNEALGALGLLARVALYRREGVTSSLWLAPVRDVLLFAEWVAACFGANVRWNQQVHTVNDSGEPALARRLSSDSHHSYRETP